VSVATAANWGAAWLVTQFFLSLTGWLGEAGTFWLRAAMCVVALTLVRFLLPETKGKSFAEIQQMWVARAAGRTGEPDTGLPVPSPGSARQSPFGAVAVT
jgi:MFS transporter, SP family, galactose:H+ symporter